MFLLLCSLVLGLFSNDVITARILGIYPIINFSHQAVFRTLTYELAKRGHELVVVTPNSGLAKHRPPDNITEIDINILCEAKNNELKRRFHRGVIIKPDDLVTLNPFNKMILSLANETMKNAELKEILEDKDKKFDLIIGESIFNFPLMYAKKYNLPFIWFSSFYGMMNNYDTLGTATMHPMLYPLILREYFSNLTVWQKINQIIFEIRYKLKVMNLGYMEHNLIKEHFGDETPDLAELLNQVDLLFLNTNPVFDIARPVPPNVIYLGALHLAPVKKLPEELKSYLDNSKRGVVYVSLGSAVNFSQMDPELVEEFLETFKALPFDILWKSDCKDVPKLDNLRVNEWFPQRDLLKHPNIKAFVTQGGLQSTDEAIDAEVPLVGLPVKGDQWYNTEQYLKQGIGKRLDLMTLKAKDLIDAVNAVIEDESYRKNLAKLKELMNDQPETSLERAVWWTEYVIRHKGAKHLRSPAFNISAWEFYMLDLLFILLAVVVTALFLLLRFVKGLKRFLRLKLKED